MRETTGVEADRVDVTGQHSTDPSRLGALVARKR